MFSDPAYSVLDVCRCGTEPILFDKIYHSLLYYYHYYIRSLLIVTIWNFMVATIFLNHFMLFQDILVGLFLNFLLVATDWPAGP